MLAFKIDPIQELKKHGITTTRLRRDRLIGEGTLTAWRKGIPALTGATLATLCELLHRQPGAILEWIPDGSPAAEEEQRRRDSIRGGRA